MLCSYTIVFTLSLLLSIFDWPLLIQKLQTYSSLLNQSNIYDKGRGEVKIRTKNQNQGMKHTKLKHCKPATAKKNPWKHTMRLVICDVHCKCRLSFSHSNSTMCCICGNRMQRLFACVSLYCASHHWLYGMHKRIDAVLCKSNNWNKHK